MTRGPDMTPAHSGSAPFEGLAVHKPQLPSGNGARHCA